MTNRKKLKRIAIGVGGGVVLALGVAMIVLPGPAFIMIPAGLAILAIEFHWARRWLTRAKSWVANAKTKIKRGGRKLPPSGTQPETAIDKLCTGME